MKERPILFSAPMVRAILDGRKTQTRRVVKRHSSDCIGWFDDGDGLWAQRFIAPDGSPHLKAWRDRCRYGQPGDRLWVRETWSVPHAFDHLPPRLIPADANLHFSASEERGGLRWRPSIHMPRWASRILLEIVSVRVERLQEISEADALAEGVSSVRSQDWDREHFPVWRDNFEQAVEAGCKPPVGPLPTEVFQTLWRDINGTDSWDANPWVWVIEFKQVQP